MAPEALVSLSSRTESMGAADSNLGHSTVQVPEGSDPYAWSDELLDIDGPEEASSEESHDMTWEPPIVEEADMKYRVDAFTPTRYMEIEEHIVYDQYVVNIYTGLRKTWPAGEDVINDVDVATTLLCLIVLTAPHKIPLRREWSDVTNIRRLAEQKIVRECLADPVERKRFAQLRSLCLWYEGYTYWF
ncbi:hypothetical protein CERSUDRAFT_96264 [Gelatoporia subvermispora B]|uniref:Uncharacterized protein n=1 Tax=Ceriporiopsis subvermispora (strain B) TaxID=914234 RepID=M2QVC4_CERS8|nr:hypothetical protein CERSUDRAFT_96264 [Gelatoporia subvermispora B]